MRDVPAPLRSPGEVLVAVEACGVCGTDVGVVAGELDFARPPVVLGHEVFGRVVQADSESWVGRGAAVDPQVVCGTCRFCRRGLLNLCEHLSHLGMNRHGGMARWVVVPAANVHLLPDGVDPRAGALVEPLACVLAAWTRARPAVGERVHVVGDGPTALLFVQVARAAGMRVTASGLRTDRLAKAREMGAEETWLAGEAPADVAEVVVEAAGGEGSFADAVRLCAPGGRILLFAHHGRPRQVPLGPVLLKELTILTSRSSNHAWPAAVSMLVAGRVDPARLVEAERSLEEVPELLRRMREGREPALKSVVRLHADG